MAKAKKQSKQFKMQQSEVRERREEYTAPWDNVSMEECYALVQSGQKKCSCRDGSKEGGCVCRPCQEKMKAAGKELCDAAKGEGICDTAKGCKRCPLYKPCWEAE